MGIFRFGLGSLGALLLVNASSLAWASDAGTKPVAAWIDFRLAHAESAREWLDRGLSKTRYGSKSGSGWDAEVAEAAVVWKPTLSPALSGHFHLQHDPDQGIAAGAVEAFLRYRILPRAGWRLSARAGRYFPPVSFEHDGPGWGLTRTLTPSAINSWIGEEVAVAGVEMRAARTFGDHHLDIRFSAFGDNDTSGTLLSFRGWAMHDVKTMVGGVVPIPDSAARRALVPSQAEDTDPSREIDDKLGYYGAVRWKIGRELTTMVTYYHNQGDPEQLDDRQYGWGTEFLAAGMSFAPNDDVELIAQGMVGGSSMGGRPHANGSRAYDSEFKSAFLLASWVVDENSVLSSRVDIFSTKDDATAAPSRQEQGWAGTLAWRKGVSDLVEVGTEAVFIEHDRGDDGTVSEVQLQSMVRLRF